MNKEQKYQDISNRIEILRSFLNTWYISNETHQPEDVLLSKQAMKEFQKQYFPHHNTEINYEEVRRLRSDLRCFFQTHMLDNLLNDWLRTYQFTVSIEEDELDNCMLTYQPMLGYTSFCHDVLKLLLDVIDNSHLSRLKMCPDCQWIFYDRSNNNSKRWCNMSGSGGKGRSCGSIAKVRRWREKVK